MCGAETRHFNDLESVQKLYAPSPFLLFFLLLQNFVCDRPCGIGLFVPQNSRELAEKHHQADSQRVSSGGGGAHSGWTPT